MVRTWTCRNGHRWDAPTGPAAGPALCPVCGQPPHTATSVGADAATLPPCERPAALDAAETLAGPVQTPSLPLPDKAVPGYEILKVLGRGGMGVVYKARHVQLKRIVALKMILAGAHAGPEALSRFNREARAAANLRHPNIVQVHEVGVADGRPYLALEYVEGGSLQGRLKGVPWGQRKAAALVQTLARAVHAAHCQKIVHRDLKPANILLAADDTPKITDFGLAKRLDGNETAHTETGAIVGTPGYMAPEQAEGRKDVGPATDVYALGAILYELLTGRPPFQSARMVDTIMQVLSQEPTPPSRLRSGLDRDLEAVCLKCLEKDPKKRYHSSRALADDLRRFLDGAPIRARGSWAWERAFKWARRKPVHAALVAVSTLACLLLLAVVVLVFRLARLGGTPAPSSAPSPAAQAPPPLPQGNPPPLARPSVQVGGRRRIDWPGAQAFSLAFTPDGHGLLVGSDREPFLRLFEVETGKEVRSFPGHTARVNDVAIRGRLALSGSDDHTVRLWDLESGRQVEETIDHGAPVSRVALTPDGKQALFTGADNAVHLCRLMLRPRHPLFMPTTAAVRALAISPNGFRALAACADAQVIEWDLRTNDGVRRWKGGTCAAYSGDGMTILTADGATLRLWNAGTGNEVWSLPCARQGHSFVSPGPTGAWGLATADPSPAIDLWDFDSKRVVYTFEAEATLSRGVVSPDGRHIACGARDAVYCWPIAPAAAPP